jgi:hypothetical protein
VTRAIIVAAFALVACGQPLPDAECDPNPAFVGSALTCGDAVTAAVAALPDEHPTIERIQFLYGSATPCCSRIYPRGEEQPVDGYVVFTYVDGAEREYVPVQWYGGKLSAGSLSDY